MDGEGEEGGGAAAGGGGGGPTMHPFERSDFHSAGFTISAFLSV